MAKNVSDELKLLPGFLIRRAHQISAAILNEEFGDLGITPSQFAVLAVIEATPESDQISVANIAKLDRSTMTLVMTKLERSGLVVRESDKVDRRRKTLSITHRGRELLITAKANGRRARRRQLDAFTAADAVEFMRLLRQFVETLEGGRTERANAESAER